MFTTEPFVEGTTPYYILLLREPNEKMLNDFNNLEKRRIAIDISTSDLKEAFMTNYSAIITNIGGESLFNNIYNRYYSNTATSCLPVAPLESDRTNTFGGQNVYTTAYTNFPTGTGLNVVSDGGFVTIDDTPLYSLTGTTKTSKTKTDIQTTLNTKATAYALSIYNSANSSMSSSRPTYHLPWTCSDECVTGFNQSTTIPSVTSLPSALQTDITKEVTNFLTYYNTGKIDDACTAKGFSYAINAYHTGTEGATDTVTTSTGTYTPTESNVAWYACNSNQSSYFNSTDITTLKNNISNKIKDYIKTSDFQSTNPGWTCSNTDYVPTYPSLTALEQATSETQTNKYFNGILIKGYISSGKNANSIIANEVGPDHIDRLKNI